MTFSLKATLLLVTILALLLAGLRINQQYLYYQNGSVTVYHHANILHGFVLRSWYVQHYKNNPSSGWEEDGNGYWREGEDVMPLKALDYEERWSKTILPTIKASNKHKDFVPRGFASTPIETVAFFALCCVAFFLVGYRSGAKSGYRFGANRPS